MVNRREMGLLKRLRLSPLPTWMLLAAIFLNWMIIAAHSDRPAPGGRSSRLRRARAATTLRPVHPRRHRRHAQLHRLGVGVSTLVPNADAAGPIVSLIFFILVALSGLYFPVKPGSGLATFTDIFPIRHLILAMVDSFNGVPGTSVWNDLLGHRRIWGRPASSWGCVAGTGRPNGAERSPRHPPRWALWPRRGLEEGGEPRRQPSDPFPPRHVRRQRRRAAGRHHRLRARSSPSPSSRSARAAWPRPSSPTGCVPATTWPSSCPTTTARTRWPSRCSGPASTTPWSTRTWPPTRRPTSSSTAAPARSSRRRRWRRWRPSWSRAPPRSSCAS